MFAEEIKEQIKQAHHSLERIVICRIRAIQTQTDYEKLLQFFYIYYHPLEQLLNKFSRRVENHLPQGLTDVQYKAYIVNYICHGT